MDALAYFSEILIDDLGRDYGALTARVVALESGFDPLDLQSNDYFLWLRAILIWIEIN